MQSRVCNDMFQNHQIPFFCLIMSADLEDSSFLFYLFFFFLFLFTCMDTFLLSMQSTLVQNVITKISYQTQPILLSDFVG